MKYNTVSGQTVVLNDNAFESKLPDMDSSPLGEQHIQDRSQVFSDGGR